MADTAALVLCGGRSRRMGRSKALLPWHGRPMIEYVVRTLREVVDQIVVVTSEELDLPVLEARVVRDEEPALGPLGGLAAGLPHVEAELAYVTGTDAPFLTPGFVEAVLRYGVAAAPVSGGFVQTLAAAYPACDGARQAQRLLEEGRRRPLELLEALEYRSIAEEELPELRSLRGFNTPDEYLSCLAEAEPGATARLEFVGHVRALAGCDALCVPVGTLASVLRRAPGTLELCRDDRVASPYLVSLGGRDFVRDASVPVGSGERVIVLDSAAGG